MPREVQAVVLLPARSVDARRAAACMPAVARAAARLVADARRGRVVCLPQAFTFGEAMSACEGKFPDAPQDRRCCRLCRAIP